MADYLETSTPFHHGQTLGIWTFDNYNPSGQNGVQMPNPIVGFVSQMPLFKNNRLRLLLSLIKLVYKLANSFRDPLYFLMMQFLPNFICHKNTALKLKLLKMTWNWINKIGQSQ